MLELLQLRWQTTSTYIFADAAFFINYIFMLPSYYTDKAAIDLAIVYDLAKC